MNLETTAQVSIYWVVFRFCCFSTGTVSVKLLWNCSCGWQNKSSNFFILPFKTTGLFPGLFQNIRQTNARKQFLRCAELPACNGTRCLCWCYASKKNVFLIGLKKLCEVFLCSVQHNWLEDTYYQVADQVHDWPFYCKNSSFVSVYWSEQSPHDTASVKDLCDLRAITISGRVLQNDAHGCWSGRCLNWAQSA